MKNKGEQRDTLTGTVAVCETVDRKITAMIISRLDLLNFGVLIYERVSRACLLTLMSR